MLKVLFDDLRPTAFLTVSPTGLDTNPGTPEAPLRSIQRAATLATPGTQISVKAGTYAERVKFSHGGAPDAPIWLVSVDGRLAAKLVDGPGNGTGSLISAFGEENLVIQGFECDGGGTLTNGIQFGMSGSDFNDRAANIVIRDNFVHDNTHDNIKVSQGTGIWVLDNVCQDAGEQGVDFVACIASYQLRNSIDRAGGSEPAQCVKGGSLNCLVALNKVTNSRFDALTLGGYSNMASVPPELRGWEANGCIFIDNETHGVAKRPMCVLGAFDCRAEHNYLERSNAGNYWDVQIVADNNGIPTTNLDWINNVFSQTPRVQCLPPNTVNGSGSHQETPGEWTVITGPYGSPLNYSVPWESAMTYQTTEAVFDGTNDYVHRNADLTGIADGPLGMLSVWIDKVDGDGTAPIIYANKSGTTVQLQWIATDNSLMMILRGAGATPEFKIRTNGAAPLEGTGRHHILISWDTNHAAGAKIGQIAIDDVVLTPLLTDTGAAFNVDYTRPDHAVGASTAGNSKLNGKAADFYMNMAERFDITVTANRRKFINADLTPVDLGADGSTPTGNKPAIFLRGGAASFPTNLGSGGNFVVVGALTDGATFPTVTASQLTTLNLKNIGAAPMGSGGYYGCGLGFPAGMVPGGSTIEMRRADGVTSVDKFQMDGIVLHDDGSLRFCVPHWKDTQSVAAGAALDFKVYKVSGSPNNSSILTTSPVKARDFLLTVVVGGVTYDCHVNAYIDNSTNSRVISSGACCKEWRVSAPMKNSGGTAHAQLWARFYIRLHEDGSTIRVFAELLNGYPANTTAISITSLAFKDGATTLWSTGAYTHAAQAIQACVDGDGLAYWTANEPTFFVSYDQAFLADAKLLWLLDHSAALISAIGSAPADNYGVMDQGGLLGSQDQPGASQWIGPIPRWDACAYITQDANWAKYARTQALGALAGPSHFYQASNFNPIVLNGGTYSGLTGSSSISWEVAATITITGQLPDYSYETTHIPHWCFYQYITTGDHWFLDEIQALPIGALGSRNPGGDTYARNPMGLGSAHDKNYTGLGFQVSAAARGCAWWINILGDAAWVTPDNDPAKQYFDDLLATQFAGLEDYLLWQQSNTVGLATLGIYIFEDAAGSKCSPWMHDYLGIILAKEVDRGTLLTTNKLWADHEIKWTLGRMVNGCMNRAFPYRMGTENGVFEDFSHFPATAWSQVYVDLDGDDVLNTQFTPSCPGSGVNSGQPYTGGHSYPAIGHAHVWCLEHLGIAGANTARVYLDANEDASQANWAGNPQWKIRP